MLDIFFHFLHSFVSQTRLVLIFPALLISLLQNHDFVAVDLLQIVNNAHEYLATGDVLYPFLLDAYSIELMDIFQSLSQFYNASLLLNDVIAQRGIVIVGEIIVMLLIVIVVMRTIHLRLWS